MIIFWSSPNSLHQLFMPETTPIYSNCESVQLVRECLNIDGNRHRLFSEFLKPPTDFHGFISKWFQLYRQQRESLTGVEQIAEQLAFQG